VPLSPPLSCPGVFGVFFNKPLLGVPDVLSPLLFYSDFYRQVLLSTLCPYRVYTRGSGFFIAVPPVTLLSCQDVPSVLWPFFVTKVPFQIIHKGTSSPFLTQGLVTGDVSSRFLTLTEFFSRVHRWCFGLQFVNN